MSEVPRKKHRIPCTPVSKRSAAKVPSSVLSEGNLESSEGRLEEEEYYPGHSVQFYGESDGFDKYPPVYSYTSDTHKNEIKVGDTLPYGQRLFEGNTENVVRMKDIGANKRLLLIGILGSYTPDCWNRHLFRILKRYDYYKARGVDHICCMATNDPYTHSSWGSFLGSGDKMLLWSDLTTKYTKALGMDVTVPWLDHNIRSKRFVLLADDMVVSKVLIAPDESQSVKWDCEHLVKAKLEDEIDDENYDFI